MAAFSAPAEGRWTVGATLPRDRGRALRRFLRRARSLRRGGRAGRSYPVILRSSSSAIWASSFPVPRHG